MAWEIINRDDKFQGSNRPFISVSSDHFSFNSLFVRINELGPDKRVTIYADSNKLKLGFEFHPDEKPNSFALTRASSDKKGKKRTALNCAARGVVIKYPWIKSVTKLSIKHRRFEPKKEGNLWVIYLSPAFEERKARESKDIRSNLQGIYRYLREDGEIVYIGRGNIKDRLISPDRKEWDFDIVEYSILEDPDEQIKWEDYWITKFREENGGRLPFYNKVQGISRNDKE